MDQVHVIRHKVLVDGRSQRQVAKEFGVSRVTVRKYVEGAEPVRRESQPRARPVWEKVSPRIDAVLAASKDWTGGKQQLTATRLHELLIGEGHQVGASLVKAAVAEWKRQRREVFVPLTYRPGDGARRDRRHASEGVALPDAADVFGPRLRLDLRAPGPSQLPGRPRAGLRALRGCPGPPRVRQSESGGRPDLVGGERTLTARFAALAS